MINENLELRQRQALNEAIDMYQPYKANVMHRSHKDGRDRLYAINSIYTIDDFCKKTEKAWTDKGLRLTRISGVEYIMETL